ncbi:MAG: hypothetical protein J4F46_00705 [Dehalococcoidia bacterium]|nr:hypothetical protein [Dehalococcoidia bacterium]
MAPLLALAAFNALLAACGEAEPTSVNPTAVPTATQDRQSATREVASFTPTPPPTRPPRDERVGAQIGDHWHASIYVEICGTALYFPPSPGGVHSHGDGFIHIHPEDVNETGSQANLGRFFDSFPYDIDTGHIRSARGELFENGDACPGGLPGRVQVIANGKDVTEDFRSYILRDGDNVEVFFK